MTSRGENMALLPAVILMSSNTFLDHLLLSRTSAR
jgi:hypothetical protein